MKTIPELLRFIVTHIDEGIESGDAPIQPPALLRLDGADVATAVGGVALHVKPLDAHPAVALAGFTAPPEWFAIGVVTSGWQQDLRSGERSRVRLTTIVCRDGSEVVAVRVEGAELRFLDGRGEGCVPDTLRNVLELVA